MNYQYSPAQAASLLFQWYETTGFDDRGGDSMVWSHDLIHILLGLSNSMVDELIVTCYEAVTPRLLSYEECRYYWEEANSLYGGTAQYDAEQYALIVGGYQARSVQDIVCLADPCWWGQFVREYDLLTNDYEIF